MVIEDVYTINIVIFPIFRPSTPTSTAYLVEAEISVPSHTQSSASSSVGSHLPDTPTVSKSSGRYPMFSLLNYHILLKKLNHKHWPLLINLEAQCL